MSWLVKRPQVSDPAMFYTLGLNKTIIIVGLGNPGKKYMYNRHNIGFICIDEFVNKTDEMSDWVVKKDMKCIISTGQIADSRIIAIKPNTYMNKSGEAVMEVANFYKVNASNVCVIHDELDINYGQIRLRLSGSSAGHNGIQSISKLIGKEYYRIRIGIGPKPTKINSENFVLMNFSDYESKQINNLTKEVLAILSEYIFSAKLINETRSFIV